MAVAHPGPPAIAEQIDDGLGRAMDGDRYAFDEVSFGPRAEQFRFEANKSERRVGDAGMAILGTDRHPNSRRDSVREFVESQCRDEGNDTLGNTFGRFRQRMIGIERRAGQLIEAPTEFG